MKENKSFKVTLINAFEEKNTSNVLKTLTRFGECGKCTTRSAVYPL